MFGTQQHFGNIGGRKHENPGKTKHAVSGLANIVLQPLYLVFTCLSYWPAKGLSKVIDKFTSQSNIKSLKNYSNMLSHKAQKHSEKVVGFVNTLLSSIFTTIIWTVASVLTLQVLLINKCISGK